MLAATPAAPASAIMYPTTGDYGHQHSNLMDTPPQFKKHKNLPRPQESHFIGQRSHTRPKDPIMLTAALAATRSQGAGSRPVKHQARRMDSGPDLPPTPPPQARASSGNHHHIQHSRTVDSRRVQTTQATLRHPPVTPPEQMSPPTPDVTPPQAQTTVKTLRPSQDRSITGTTPSESVTESFTTAREEQMSSEDEAHRFMGRSAPVASANHQLSNQNNTRFQDPRAVHSAAVENALQQLATHADDPYTPRTQTDLSAFDGKWSLAADLEKDRRIESDQDKRATQIINGRKKRHDPRIPRNMTEPTLHGLIVEDNVVNMTAASRAARYMHTRDGALPDASPVSSSRPSLSETSFSVDAKRSSGTSAQSAASAVVEVLLMDRMPRRQQTLRHVKKHQTLRSVSQTETILPRRDAASTRNPSLPMEPRLDDRPAPEDPVPATRPPRSISNGRARREVWNSGAIPVVVVPERQSSHRSRHSREPSLRSTSRSRSRRSNSLDSTGIDLHRPKHSVANTGSQARRPRRSSITIGDDDEFTIDFPPAIPPRSSSLSAPTSRNVSRTTSLAARSAKSTINISPTINIEPAVEAAPSTPKARRFSFEQTENQDDDMIDVISIDNLSARKFSSRNTPFSIASLDTMGTAAEVSEAHAIQMFQHQNSSVLVVNHSNRPSEASDRTLEQPKDSVAQTAPIIVASGPGDILPVTPPDQTQEITTDYNSPLRNPRVPPSPPAPSVGPPAIHLIPATPSGESNAQDHDKNLRSYFDTSDSSPFRRVSILRGAFRRRRNSIDYPPSSTKQPNLLTRTFSLSRQLGKTLDTGLRPRSKTEMEWLPTHTKDELEPPESHKLHPFWQPQDGSQPCEFGSKCPHHGSRSHGPAPKRSLSNRIKTTFSILPARYDEVYPSALPSPERRTIRRTDSGSLKVMKRRSSAESLPHSAQMQDQATIAKGGSMQRGPIFPRKGGGLQRRFSLSSKLDELPYISSIISERRRERRTQELRQSISAPREVRDSMGEVIRHDGSGHERQSQYVNVPDI